MTIAWGISKKFSFISSLLFLWVIFSSVRVFIMVPSPWNGSSPEAVNGFNVLAASALLEIGICIGAIYALSFGTWKKIFKLVSVVNSLWIIIGWFFSAPWGVLLNPSMSGCFAVVLLPLLFYDEEVAGFSPLLSVIAILMTGRSLPIAALFLMLCLFCLKERRLISAAVMVVLGFPVIYFLKPKGYLGENLLFSSSGRIHVWKVSMAWWHHYLNPWIGSGLGAFNLLGRGLTKDMPGMFIWMHSDWLQVLFEMGIVGFCLVVFFYIGLLRRSKNNGHLFLSLLMYGFFALANMPGHYLLSALYGAFLLRWAFNQKAVPYELFRTTPRRTPGIQTSHP